MSATAIKAEIVLAKARQCVEAIYEDRKRRDEHWLKEKMLTISKLDKFWNKATFGLCKLKTEVRLKQLADDSLRGLGFGLEYPDQLTDDRWLSHAQNLISLAKQSHDGMVYVDDEDIAVIEWVK